MLVEQLLGCCGRLLGHRVGGSRARIEVDAQLVAVLQVGRTHGPRVEAEAAQVDSPHQVGEIGNHEGPRLRAVGGLHDGRVQPLRCPVGDSLLEEVRAAGAVGEPLQQHRTIAHLAHDGCLHGEVVVDQIELGVAAGGEEDLVGTGDGDRAPGRREISTGSLTTATVFRPASYRRAHGGDARRRSDAGHDRHGRRLRRPQRAHRSAAHADRVDEDASRHRLAVRRA